jgi:DHA1 family bicyclomycin/chloramphenicol resistance-like MFS transporter
MTGRSLALPALSTPEFVALFSLTTSLIALSIDAILPAQRAIGEALAVTDPNATQLIVTLFILGMVFGEMFFGPLSDAIGRKRAILLGLAIYAAGTLVAMTAASLEQVLLGRVIQGIGVSGPKIASRALVRDQYEGAAMARIMSFIMMVFILVPMLAPALGQAILAVADWRAIFFVFLAIAATVALWMQLRQPETLPPSRRIRFSPALIVSNGALILRHAKVMAYTFSAGLIFGAMLLYLSTVQAIFIDLYGVGDDFALYFAFLALAIGLAAFSNSQLVQHYGMHRLAVIALLGLTLSSAVLLAVALMHGGVPPFPAFMAICFAAFFCNGLLFGNINAMAMQSLGRVAGLGASMIASISSLVAVILSVAVGRFYDQTVVPLACGFLLAAMVSLALVLAAHRSTAGDV